jgi:hypothetical protein
MTNTGFRDLLRGLSTAAGLAAGVLPGAGSTVAGILRSALGLAADLAATGLDPIKEIERIRKRAPLLADVEREWEEQMRERFGLPEPDIYEES